MYVIELKDVPASCEAGEATWLYVGETSHTPEVRFEQHRTGVKSARGLKRQAFRLRPDLYEGLPAYASSGEAEAAEQKVAEVLRVQGYCVRTGPPREAQTP